MLRLGVDLKLFDAMVKCSNKSPDVEVSIQQLAHEIGAEPLLLGMRLTAVITADVKIIH